MQPVPPFWFTMRQGKIEAAGDNMIRLKAPNSPEAIILIRKGENGLWAGALRKQSDGPDVTVTDPKYAQEADAWNAAFELYRTEIVT